MNRFPICSIGAVAVTVALLGFSACSKAPTIQTAEALASELHLTNGHLSQIGHSNYFTGLMIEKYAGGRLQSRCSVSNGVLWGLSEGWHTNGQLQVQENFRDGLADGLRTKWEINGVKLSEATIAGGKLNGRFRRWYTNGILAEEVEMKADKPHGLARAWYPTGSPKAEMRMADGSVVQQKRWEDSELPAAGLASSTRASYP